MLRAVCTVRPTETTGEMAEASSLSHPEGDHPTKIKKGKKKKWMSSFSRIISCSAISLLIFEVFFYVNLFVDTMLCKSFDG